MSASATLELWYPVKHKNDYNVLHFLIKSSIQNYRVCSTFLDTEIHMKQIAIIARNHIVLSSLCLCLVLLRVGPFLLQLLADAPLFNPCFGIYVNSTMRFISSPNTFSSAGWLASSRPFL